MFISLILTITANYGNVKQLLGFLFLSVLDYFRLPYSFILSLSYFFLCNLILFVHFVYVETSKRFNLYPKNDPV